jgi:hypothetical protein
LLNNFGIQSLEHSCLNFWRKFGLKRAKRNESGNRRYHAQRRPRAATSAPPYPARARTSRRRKTPRSEAHAAATVHLRLMTRVSGLGQRHAAYAYSPAGEPPCAIGRWLRRTSPPAPRPSPSSCRSRSYRATASARPRPPSAIGATDDLAASLALCGNQQP